MNDTTTTNKSESKADSFRQRHPKLYQFLLVILIVAVGTFILVITVVFKKAPPKEEPPVLAPLVEVRSLHQADIPMVVEGYGTVRAKVQVEIVPQVSGNVVYVHPQFKNGGYIRADEAIVRIDPRDYELAVEQTLASVAQAEVKLEMEKAEAEVARSEWRQLHPDSEPNSPLVFRGPQIRQAEATLDSAQAALATAKLNLDRTEVKLPVDVRIVREDIDLGQLVSRGQSIGSAYGVQAIEIEVPLEDRELAWFDIPSEPFIANHGRQGSKAYVYADFAGSRHQWHGYVTRTVGQVDERSRMISVVVEVAEPFKVTDERPALMPGIFVDVDISGHTLEGGMAIPRDALHNKNEVWVVDGNHLHIQPLDVVRWGRDSAFIRSGLPDGAKVVVSALETAVEGMKVRTAKPGETDPNNVVYAYDGNDTAVAADANAESAGGM